MVLSDLAKQLKPYILRWIDGVGAGFVRLAGSSGGQTVYGGTAANEDLTLEGTSHATKTSSYIILQPTSGNVGIGTTSPSSALDVIGNAEFGGTIGSFTTTPDRWVNVYSATEGHEVAFGLNSAEGTNNRRVKFFLDDTTGLWGFDTSGSSGLADFVIQRAGTTQFFIGTAGGNSNVGINDAAPTGKLHVDQSSTTAAIPVLKLDQADISEGFIDFIGTSAASADGPISTWTVATIAGYVRCEINGTGYWMPYYNAPTS